MKKKRESFSIKFKWENCIKPYENKSLCRGFIIISYLGGKIMKKQVISAFISAAMVLSLAACGGSGTPTTSGEGNAAAQDSTAAGGAVDTSNASYTIRIGMPTAGKHFQNFTAEQYKEAIETATNGDIAVQIYPSSQLGTSTQMIQGVQDGSIEAVMIPSSYFTSFAPAVAVTDIPYFFEDSQQIYEILNSKENPLNDYLYTYGFKVAGWLKNTPRYILSQTKYESMADLKNQKIWCLPSTTLQDELTAYGASPQILDPSDIAVSLENGTVDGVETDVLFMNSQGLGESAKYLNEIPATPMTNLFCFSADWYDTLPADYQELLVSTAEDVISGKEVDYVNKQYEGSLAALQEAGVEIAEPSETLTSELKAASTSVKEAFIATDDKCADIYSQLEAMINK